MQKFSTGMKCLAYLIVAYYDSPPSIRAFKSWHDMCIYIVLKSSLKEVIYMTNKFEIKPLDVEPKRDYVKELLVALPIIFGTVWLFGCFADRVFGAEENAKEARKQGYDV